MKCNKYLLIKTAIAVFFFAIPFLCLAQPGLKEFADATREVKRDYNALTRLVQVLGGISGIAGGIRIYTNWQLGKRNIDAQIVGWFGACIFLNLASLFISGLYGM